MAGKDLKNFYFGTLNEIIVNIVMCRIVVSLFFDMLQKKGQDRNIISRYLN
jgi:hypothetical protein